MFLEIVKSEGGFTYNKKTKLFVDSGFAVGCNNKMLYIPISELTEETIELYIQTQTMSEIIGCWHDKETGYVILELPRIFTLLDLAYDTAIIHKQKSIYDIDRDILITLN